MSERGYSSYALSDNSLPYYYVMYTEDDVIVYTALCEQHSQQLFTG